MNAANDTTELLSEMIGLIYEAAADMSLWPRLLESMSSYLEMTLDPPTGVSSLGQSERSLIHFLAPHFERAHVIHQQLTEVVAERELLEGVMNRLPLGAAIIDAQCNAISMNRALVSLLQSGGLLSLEAGELLSSPPLALRQAVEQVVSGARDEVVVHLLNDEVSLSLFVSGGGAAARPAARRNRLMVLVASRTSHALSEQGLKDFFGLTPAEARVTQKFALGGTLEECADSLNISSSTFRTHLKHVFSKVGVKRQSELMQAIYGSPLWLHNDVQRTSQTDNAELPVAIGMSAAENQRIRMQDGRWLYFSDSGDPLGYPVILMHGIAGSRHLRHPDDALLLQEGIRLIIPERPGSGDSDPLPGREVGDWPQDIAALTAHLGVGRFSVLGYSAGTAYALAVAAALPERVQTVHIVAAMPPIEDIKDLRAYNSVFRMALIVAKFTPSLLPVLMRIMIKDIRENVYHYLESLLLDAPELDRQVLGNPRLRASITVGLRASVRRGEYEVAQEVMLAAREWRVDMGKVTMPVQLWHGDRDPLVSSSGAEKLVRLLPDARLLFIPGAGHYLLYSHWQELLRSMRPSSIN